MTSHTRNKVLCAAKLLSKVKLSEKEALEYLKNTGILLTNAQFNLVWYLTSNKQRREDNGNNIQ